jgi:hypothetical protein
MSRTESVAAPRQLWWVDCDAAPEAKLPILSVGSRVQWTCKFGPPKLGTVVERVPRAKFLVRFDDGDTALLRGARCRTAAPPDGKLAALRSLAHRTNTFHNRTLAPNDRYR